MAKRYGDKTALIYDHGVFVSLAETLAKDFERVLYCVPWESSFPDSNALLIGSGIPGVTRVNSIWPYIDEIDLFVFPDCYDGPLQVYLASIGKRVWGGRMGEELELCREDSKRHCAMLGIPIGPYQKITGLDALRDHLREHDDRYVKISMTRGDMESFHAKHYRLIEPRLDDLEDRLGPKKQFMQFIVEEPIRPAIEVGYDGFTIDGKWPSGAIYGIELKDKGYVGKVTRYTSLPDSVRNVNDKLSDTFRRYQYRGFWSSEVRVRPDGKGYFIDATARCGSPPSELYQMMMENIAEIILEGAAGNLIEPKFSAPWGAQLMLMSEWAMKKWQAVDFPSSFRENVKLRNLAVIDGRSYYVPDKSGCMVIGSVVATGSTMQSAIDACKKIAEKIEGHCLDVDTAALDEGRVEFAKLDKISVNGKAA